MKLVHLLYFDLFLLLEQIAEMQAKYETEQLNTSSGDCFVDPSVIRMLNHFRAQQAF